MGRITATIEIDIDKDALRKHNMTEGDVLANLVLGGWDDGGYRLFVKSDQNCNDVLGHSFIAKKDFTPDWVKNDGHDGYRRLIYGEISTGYLQHELPAKVKDALLDDTVVIDRLATKLQEYMQRDGFSENAALDKIWADDIRGTVKHLWKCQVANAFHCRPITIKGNEVFVNYSCQDGTYKITKDEYGDLYCQREGEYIIRPLRFRIQDIQAGDAFVFNGCGLFIAKDDAHQNTDEPDEPWVVYAREDSEIGYFEEDMPAESLQAKILFLMEELKPIHFRCI